MNMLRMQALTGTTLALFFSTLSSYPAIAGAIDLSRQTHLISQAETGEMTTVEGVIESIDGDVITVRTADEQMVDIQYPEVEQQTLGLEPGDAIIATVSMTEGEAVAVAEDVQLTTSEAAAEATDEATGEVITESEETTEVTTEEGTTTVTDETTTTEEVTTETTEEDVVVESETTTPESPEATVTESTEVEAEETTVEEQEPVRALW